MQQLLLWQERNREGRLTRLKLSFCKYPRPQNLKEAAANSYVNITDFPGFLNFQDQNVIYLFIFWLLSFTCRIM